MTDNNAPFRFEDLNGKPEPESWGPTYNIKRKRGQTISEAVREAHSVVWKRDPVFHSNSPSGQAFEFSAAKHRARLKAEFTAMCNADKRNWAQSQGIREAYKQAMVAKAARLAIQPANGS